MQTALRRITVFLGAVILYLVCLDRGASLWDCPEYILSAWRLEVGHPPGNPTWQLTANVLSHLGADAGHAAVIINGMSAVAMALAAVFLADIIALLMGGGWIIPACGALCYAWCDSAIFSAVEAEVYALSAMVTALMLLLSLLWARQRRRGNIAASRRLLILTAYVAGLGVGVHELNFLIIPAMLLVYRFGSRGTKAPGSGLPTALWSLLLFIVGTTTYLIIPIRAAANPPVNMGHPSTWQAFKSYYGREQYGSKPLLYGRTPYSKPLLLESLDTATGEYSYRKYYLTETASGVKQYTYPEELNMWLPRMTSSHPADIEFYEAWAGMTRPEMEEVMVATATDSTGRQVAKMKPQTGERERELFYKPTYLQQLRYFLGYQVGFMYFRYLLWNYVGRQNNVHSTGDPSRGNFITGIPAIDDAMLGPQDDLPAKLRQGNKGYNRYYMVPFLFGIAGIAWLLCRGRRGRRVCAIVAMFFIFTGVLIVVYLNQDPGEPRERDYSFLGSYMAFAIWIAFGMQAAAAGIGRALRAAKSRRRAVAARVLSIAVSAAVPALILSQTYDDHNRSRQGGAEAVARRIFADIPRDAIYFANGDNVIFPLWYAQEVLGIRRDVRIVAEPFLATEWYRQQLRIPGEESLPVIMSDSVPAGPGRIVERVKLDIITHNPSRVHNP